MNKQTRLLLRTTLGRIGAWGSYVIFILGARAATITPGWLKLITILVSSTIIFVFRMSIHFLIGILNKLDRLEGEQAAKKLFLQILKDQPRVDTFALYLRPFRSTGFTKIDNPDYDDNEYSSRNFTEDWLPDIEEILGTTVRPMPLVKVGNSPADMGIDGAFQFKGPNGSWEIDVRQLISLATIVFVLPGDSSVVDEVKWLSDGQFLLKTAFIMPPKEVVYGESDWKRAKEAMNHIGIELPDFRTKGMLFRFDNSGSLRHQSEIEVWTSDNLKRELGRLMKDG